jgi:hypothetical protein
MKKRERKLFEADRRMELRMRIAAKRVGTRLKIDMPILGPFKPPKEEVVDRLIERVRSL